MKSVNPATGEIIASHAAWDKDRIETALADAAEGLTRWRVTEVSERTALLTRLADAYSAHRDELARMATLEMGKTFASALAEVDKCVAAFRYYAEAGPAMLQGQRIALAGGGHVDTVWLPIGPILAIMPWNFPYWQVARFLAPCILAGNVGLLKHASNVQGCAALIERMMTVAGAPDGVFQNVPVRSDAVAAIIADEQVAAVTLTGSEPAGRAVAEQAGQALKKVVLELGGADPFIVMPSADLDAAVEQAVTARTQNSGQSCICGKRMIVHRDIYDAFLGRFAAAMDAVTVGDPFDKASDIGPLSSAEQRQSVLDQIATMTAAGATLLGGEVPDGPGAFLRPGILTGVPVDPALMGEEIFGPIAMLFKAADAADAIRIANAIPYGLGSSVWTQDAAEQELFIRDVAAGMTAINQMVASAPEAPFGGVKRSGHGRELGAVGLHEFMNLKSVYREG